MKKITFNGGNYDKANTPKGAKILKVLMKIGAVLVPIFGSRLGLTGVEMTGLSTALLGSNELLNMTGVEGK